MKKGWIIAGATFGCVAGASVGACSTSGSGGTAGGSTTTSTHATTGTGGSTTSTHATTGTGGSTTTSTHATTGTGGSTTTTTTSGTGGGDAGTCPAVTTLHPPKLDAGPGTIRCPFSPLTDGGPDEYCTPVTQHCCETPTGPATWSSACEPAGDGGTVCMTGAGHVDWQCEDPVADCTNAATPVCCAPGASIGLGAQGCANFSHIMTHTTCTTAAACPNTGNTGNVVMCTDSAECPTGQTCTPFGKDGNEVGGCM